MNAKEFVLKKLNECVLFTHDEFPDSIHHIWDKQLLRQKKLLRISGQNNLIDFKPGKNSIRLFNQDYKNGKFWYSFKYIHQILIDEYGLDNNSISKLMKDILEDDNKMKALTPNKLFLMNTHPLEDNNKMKALTPFRWLMKNKLNLEDDNKMKALTSIKCFTAGGHILEDDNKMKALTPTPLFLSRPDLEDSDKMKNLIPIDELPNSVPNLR